MDAVRATPSNRALPNQKVIATGIGQTQTKLPRSSEQKRDEQIIQPTKKLSIEIKTDLALKYRGHCLPSLI
jgi:hypothetical protein